MSVSEIKSRKVKRKMLRRKNQLKVAFIADDIKNLNKFGLSHNSTFGLMLASSCFTNRGLRLYFAQSNDLKIKKNEVFAKLQEITVKEDLKNHIQTISNKEYCLNHMVIIFARKDPPIEQNYLSYIHTLSLIPSYDNFHSLFSKTKKTLIVNSPKGILHSNEKLYAFNFPRLIPPSIVSSSKDEILGFLKQYKKVILKPLFNKGGTGVYYLNLNSKNILPLLELVLSSGNPVIAQKYLKESVHGDKRIILLNGEVLGGITRIPKKGEFRAHISRGAAYKKLNLSGQDLKICNALKPKLLEDGLFFTAIDIIGRYLIEVNFTCPANIRETGKANGIDIPHKIISWAAHVAK